MKPGAHDLGGDLRRVSVITRPDRFDLLVRIHPTQLPKLHDGELDSFCIPGVACVPPIQRLASGAPSVMYRLALTVDVPARRPGECRLV